MMYKFLYASLLFAAFFQVTPVSASDAVTYITLDAPQGGGGTYAYGISSSTVVGWYTAVPRGGHGFVYANGIYSTLDVPGSDDTNVRGVSGNTFTGQFHNSSGNHGFLDTAGTFSTLDYPGINGSTFPFGISGTTVVGNYRTSVGTHGFIETDGIYTTIDHPLATFGTTVTAVSGNTIVGIYNDDTTHGFSETGGVFTTIDYPGAIGTEIFGIDGANMVGQYIDADDSIHGFVIFNGAFIPLPDNPAAVPGHTFPTGISGNLISGYFQDASLSHGFIGTLNVPEPASLFIGFVAIAVLFRRHNSRFHS